MTVISLASSNPMRFAFSIIYTEGFRLRRKKGCHIKELSPKLFNAPYCEKSGIPSGSSKYIKKQSNSLSSLFNYSCRKTSLAGQRADSNSLWLRKSPLKFPSLHDHQSRGWSCDKLPWNFLKAAANNHIGESDKYRYDSSEFLFKFHLHNFGTAEALFLRIFLLTVITMPSMGWVRQFLPILALPFTSPTFSCNVQPEIVALWFNF